MEFPSWSKSASFVVSEEVMPSPFPGMDPFLEQPEAWHDFHQQYCVVCRAAIVRQVGPDYFVKLEERLYIHELSAEERRLLGRADIGVKRGGGSSDSAPAAGPMSAPVIGRVLPAVDIERESFIEIRDRESKQLVTVLELLSPANKQPGADREQFLAKRDRLLSSGVHYVEIDLLRGGPRLPIEDLPACDYYAMVSRAESRPRAGLWPLQLFDPLPKLPIPLASGDSDVWLDLQAALHSAYDAGGYGNYIYLTNPDPPLPPDQAEESRRLLAGAAIPTAATTN